MWAPTHDSEIKSLMLLKYKNYPGPDSFSDDVDHDDRLHHRGDGDGPRVWTGLDGDFPRHVLVVWVVRGKLTGCSNPLHFLVIFGGPWIWNGPDDDSP